MTIYFYLGAHMSDRQYIILLVGLQLLVGCWGITGFPIGLDEPFSIFHAQLPLPDLLAEVGKGNNAPLHFILLHYWMNLFGNSPLAVRSMSLLIALIATAVVYRLGRRFWQPNYAALFTGLFIFSRLNHWVALEARMYGLFTLFFVLILCAFYDLLVENKKVGWRLGLWNALLLYTHYLGGVVIMLEVFIFLIYFSQWNKNKWIQVGIALVVGVLLFTPGLSFFLDRSADFSTSGTWVAPAELKDLWQNLIKLLNNQFTLWVTLAFLIGGLIFFRPFERGKKEQVFFVSWFFVGYGLLFLLSITVQPLFFSKYLQFLTIPLFGCIVAIVAGLKAEVLQKGWFFILLIPFALSFKIVPDINRETDELVTAIKSAQDEETTVFYSPPHYNLTLAYHYDRKMFSDYENCLEKLTDKNWLPAYSAADLNWKPGTQKIIFADLEAHFLYPNNGILPFLDEHCTFIKVDSYKGNFHVYYYDVPILDASRQ